MTWYKTAKSFTDLEKWVLHGVHPEDCRRDLKHAHDKRAATKEMAHKKAEELGHHLFKEWIMDRNRCRKCGLGIQMPNILGQTSAPDVIGSAVTVKCNVHLDHVPEEYFELSDKKLEGLNKTPDITII